MSTKLRRNFLRIKSGIKEHLLLTIFGILLLAMIMIVASNLSGGPDVGASTKTQQTITAVDTGKIGPSTHNPSEFSGSHLKAVGAMLLALIGLSKLLK